MSHERLVRLTGFEPAVYGLKARCHSSWLQTRYFGFRYLLFCFRFIVFYPFHFSSYPMRDSNSRLLTENQESLPLDQSGICIMPVVRFELTICCLRGSCHNRLATQTHINNFPSLVHRLHQPPTLVVQKVFGIPTNLARSFPLASE